MYLSHKLKVYISNKAYTEISKSCVKEKEEKAASNPMPIKSLHGFYKSVEGNGNIKEDFTYF